MYVSNSARAAIRRMLAQAAPGSLPALLVGYTYREAVRIPQVNVRCYPPEMVDPDRVRMYDGVEFHEVLSTSHDLVADRTLTFVDGDFVLSTQ